MRDLALPGTENDVHGIATAITQHTHSAINEALTLHDDGGLRTAKATAFTAREHHTGDGQRGAPG